MSVRVQRSDLQKATEDKIVNVHMYTKDTYVQANVMHSIICRYLSHSHTIGRDGGEISGYQMDAIR